MRIATTFFDTIANSAEAIKKLHGLSTLSSGTHAALLKEYAKKDEFWEVLEPYPDVPTDIEFFLIILPDYVNPRHANNWLKKHGIRKVVLTRVAREKIEKVCIELKVNLLITNIIIPFTSFRVAVRWHPYNASYCAVDHFTNLARFLKDRREPSITDAHDT